MERSYAMTNANYQIIYDAVKAACRRCSQLPRGEFRFNRPGGSPWLYDQLMRAFSHSAVEAVTYEVFLAYPVNLPGEITIHRDGTIETRISR